MPLASHPSQVSALPSTAPVHEYICLFTPDLKRKQKRWQDGRLKFHTFNKRIMVYDERGNFIGDMHWREDFDFCQGEEFNLERGAVIVQVAECVGTKDQDLSELLDKRAKEVDQRHARSSASAISSPMASARPSLVSRQQPQPQPQQMQQQLQHPPHGQFRQKHLADLFNTPRGPQGRAVIPKTSPYEERVAAQASSPHDENQRPAKRRKRDVSPPSKAGYAQNLFGTALTLSSWSASAPVRSQPLITPISQGFRPSPPCRDPKPSSSRPAAVVDLTDGSQIPSVARQISDELPKSIAKRMPTADVNSVPKPSTITEKLVEKRKPTSRSARKSQDVEETLDSSDQRAPSNAYTNNRTAPRAATRARQALLSATGSRLPDPPQDDMDQTRQPGLTRSSTNEDVIEVSGFLADPHDDECPQRTLNGSSTSQAESDAPEEPKARLRIKARQRRGLLMMSNKAVPKKTTTSRVELDPSPADLENAVDNGLSALPLMGRHVPVHDDNRSQAADRTDKQGRPEHETPVGISNDVGLGEGSKAPARDQDRKSRQQAEPAEPRHMDTDEPDILSKEREKQKKCLRSDIRRGAEETSSHPGPRLASFGRRSVKSKEIIGSFDSRPSRMFREACDSAPVIPEESVKRGDDMEMSISAQDEIDTSKQDALRPGQTVRLSNPATRGRKAAKKSDAAGTVPQSVIPPSAGPAPAMGSKPDNKPGTKPASEGTGESVERMPGFSRANGGGPWSREAFDLLGCARPG